VTRGRQLPHSSHASTHIVGLRRERPVASQEGTGCRTRKWNAHVGEGRVYSKKKRRLGSRRIAHLHNLSVAAVFAAHWPEVVKCLGPHAPCPSPTKCRPTQIWTRAMKKASLFLSDGRWQACNDDTSGGQCCQQGFGKLEGSTKAHSTSRELATVAGIFPTGMRPGNGWVPKRPTEHESLRDSRSRRGDRPRKKADAVGESVTLCRVHLNLRSLRPEDLQALSFGLQPSPPLRGYGSTSRVS